MRGRTGGWNSALSRLSAQAKGRPSCHRRFCRRIAELGGVGRSFRRPAGLFDRCLPLRHDRRMVRRESVEEAAASEDAKTLDAKAARKILSALENMQEVLEQFSGQLAALTDAVDDLRQDFEWTMRNREPAGEEPFHVVSMSADPCADDLVINGLDRPAVVACAACGVSTTTTILDAMRHGWENLERDDDPHRDCTGTCPACIAQARSATLAAAPPHREPAVPIPTAASRPPLAASEPIAPKKPLTSAGQGQLF